MTEEFRKAFGNVTRVEVISASGRDLVGYYTGGAWAETQDGGRTLKIFVGEKASPTDGK